MSVMMVQIKCKLNNTELFLKLFHIQCKEIGNNKYYKKQQNICFSFQIYFSTAENRQKNNNSATR